MNNNINDFEIGLPNPKLHWVPAPVARDITCTSVLYRTETGRRIKNYAKKRTRANRNPAAGRLFLLRGPINWMRTPPQCSAVENLPFYEFI